MFTVPLSRASLVVLILVLTAGCSANTPSHDYVELTKSTPNPIGETTPNISKIYGHGQPDSEVDSPPALANKTPRSDVNVTKVERLLKEKLNQHHGLNTAGPLVSDPRLARIARHHSYDMARRDYFSHISPEGEDYHDRLEEHSYRCAGGGENIHSTIWKAQERKTEEELAQAVLESFMRSAPHNTAMIQPDLSTVGIGIYIRQDRIVFVTMALCGGPTEGS